MNFFPPPEDIEHKALCEFLRPRPACLQFIGEPTKAKSSTEFWTVATATGYAGDKDAALAAFSGTILFLMDDSVSDAVIKEHRSARAPMKHRGRGEKGKS